MATKKQADNAHDTVDNVAEKLHDVVDRAAEGLGSAEEHLRREASEAYDKVRDGKEQACEYGADLYGSVTTYVRQNPLTALGIAFVAGTVLSAMNRRR